MTAQLLKSKTEPAEPAPGVPETAPTPAHSKPVGRVPVPPRSPSSAKNKQRILLSTLDGKIEWEKMSAEARKAFEELFKTPEFLKQFGLNSQTASPFDPEQCKALYDAVSMAYQTLARMFLRWPPEVLALLTYSPEQKELLAKPTANVLAKFAPAFLAQHQEMLVFGAIFLSVTQQNFKTASGAAKEHFAKLAEERKRLQAGQPVTETAKPKTVIAAPEVPRAEVIPIVNSENGGGTQILRPFA